ncbi:HAMP domain-containing sensor histidine kinase [Sulfitobacter sp. S190]|uniref:sensor histidine kinase n=1 Tax=Sulfitobacter sp. S190 TaxID=2867022 RepID=UPI0021A3831C|nr:ATP-binding protein [Sulfitobacter sp. S190]UWR21912.1 sensor histidine kinase [Sulfitobacter sp. S190]
MSVRIATLGRQMVLLIAGAVAVGLCAAWVWAQSGAAWRAHQAQAYQAGLLTYPALQNGADAAAGMALRPLSVVDQAMANQGAFERLSGMPRPALVTTVPIRGAQGLGRGGRPVTFVVVSSRLRYRVADLPNRAGQTPAETTAALFRLLASYCADPVVLAHVADEPWVVVEGDAVWGCAARPADRRLLTVVLAILALAVLVTLGLNTAGYFSEFAQTLRARRPMGGPQSYQTRGPAELQDVVAAVNDYLSHERQQLQQRAAVLSGVSHDLGTPATRLRLRTALIGDDDLRDKLEGDIDSMTGMIESVLTYTRAELNSEVPRQLSLRSLIEAIVSDYEDTGRAVRFGGVQAVRMSQTASVFGLGGSDRVLPADGQIIVTARPVSLERAVCNLIDNALKYGRRATVMLEVAAESATIIVEDEGSDTAAKDIEALIAPFQRGDNTMAIEGYGLGLTIVGAIAKLHGGDLSFADSARGLSARLRIARS